MNTASVRAAVGRWPLGQWDVKRSSAPAAGRIAAFDGAENRHDPLAALRRDYTITGAAKTAAVSRRS
jgi:hypothetical protein